MPSIPKHAAHTPWSVLQETEVFSRPPYVSVVQQAVRTGRGQRIDDFYQVRLRSFALVVPVLETGQVQVIRQYKHGPGKVGLGFAAGFLDPDEAPLACAKREMLEEMGLHAAEITPLGTYVDNGNQRGSTGHYFLARGCTHVAAPAPGDLEDFEYLSLSVKDVDNALRDGQFAVIHHVAAWGLARQRL